MTWYRTRRLDPMLVAFNLSNASGKALRVPAGKSLCHFFGDSHSGPRCRKRRHVQAGGQALIAIEEPPTTRCDLGAWHQLLNGLSVAEVKSRQQQYGPNKRKVKRSTPTWNLFLRQFHQPLLTTFEHTDNERPIDSDLMPTLKPRITETSEAGKACNALPG